MPMQPTRRQFLKDTALLSIAAAAVQGASGLCAAEPSPGTLPTIKLGSLVVSRLFLGSNPFFGFAHKQDDTPNQMKRFYTEERIMAVLDEAAEHGITAVWTPSYDHWIRLWNKYKEKGGKLKMWIGQPDPPAERMKDHIAACAKNGTPAICIQGQRVDEQFQEGRFDTVRKWLDYIHSFGLPAGIASHRPETHLIAEDKKLPTDFYHQCLYQPENYDPSGREAALATIRKIDKPVVAYKVLAAGRLSPQEAIPYVLKHLRPKDGLCIGVFPKDDPHQIAQNIRLTRQLTT